MREGDGGHHTFAQCLAERSNRRSASARTSNRTEEHALKVAMLCFDGESRVKVVEELYILKGCGWLSNLVSEMSYVNGCTACDYS